MPPHQEVRTTFLCGDKPHFILVNLAFLLSNWHFQIMHLPPSSNALKKPKGCSHFYKATPAGNHQENVEHPNCSCDIDQAEQNSPTDLAAKIRMEGGKTNCYVGDPYVKEVKRRQLTKNFLSVTFLLMFHSAVKRQCFRSNCLASAV